MPNPISDIKDKFKKDNVSVINADPVTPVVNDSPVDPNKGTMNPEKRTGIDILTRLTQRSNQTMMAGVNKAKELHSQFIDTEHVFWGLLTDPGIYKLLSEMKKTPSEIQTDVEAVLKQGDSHDSPQFSPRVKRVLEYSLSAARSLGYEFISPEHLLLALIQEGEGQAAQIMSKHGLSVEEVNKKISGKTTSVAGEETKKQLSAIEQFSHDLTKAAKDGKLDPVVARSAEIERMMHILLRRSKNNPVLIGEAGVGKTAIVEGLAQRIASGNVPEPLMNKRILSIDLMSIIAGASHRGEFEERLKNLIKEIKASKGEIIIFIDEIHNMVGAGGGGNSMDASNILKPSLARGELQTIGATTVAEYRKYMEKDRALERRFQPVMDDEPTPEKALQMVRALKDKYEAFHKVSIPEAALEAAVRLSHRYIGDRFLPDKAIDLIDEAASSIRLPSISLPEEIQSLNEQIKRLIADKEEAVKINDDVQIIGLDRKLKKFQQELGEKQKAYEMKKATTTTEVTVEAIQDIVSRWTNIPISKLTESETNKLLNLEDMLHARLIGQKQAVTAVAEAVRRGRAGLKSTKRPVGSFIFMGPTGVGKTELAKALAEILFGSEERIVRLDMTEYMEKHEVAKLIGAPPGYVGYEEGGQLTEAVRRHPYSVVLMDEVEKAHPDVFNILLQVLDDGRLTDNKGRTIDFKNTILIATSNIGTELIQEDMVQEGTFEAVVEPVSTLVYSPTGRIVLTQGNRMWQKENRDVAWKYGALEDYFQGEDLSQAAPLDLKQKFPVDGFDTHMIAPSGEELITRDNRLWRRTSTTSKAWELSKLLDYFKGHEVTNAGADKPEQQLPTAKLSTVAVSPSETQIITYGDRYWMRNGMASLKWETGFLADYVIGTLTGNSIVQEVAIVAPQVAAVSTSGPSEPDIELQKKVKELMTSDSGQLVEKIDKSEPLPADGWSAHFFNDKGEEFIVKGRKYWKRKQFNEKTWQSGMLPELFTSYTIQNAAPDSVEQMHPLGEEVNKLQTEQESEDKKKYAQLKKMLTEKLQEFFRPELINRFDDVLVFKPLSQSELLKIVDLQIAGLADLLEDQNIGLQVSDSAKKELGVEGYDPMFGARPLRRTIQRMLENPVSSMIIKGELKSGDIVIVDYNGSEFIFTANTRLKRPSKIETEVNTMDNNNLQQDPTQTPPVVPPVTETSKVDAPAPTSGIPVDDVSQPVVPETPPVPVVPSVDIATKMQTPWSS